MNDPSLADRACGIVINLEGGFVNDPNDPGGATKFGISIKFAGSINLDIDGDGQTTNADIRALTFAQARELYTAHFWNELSCDFMPYGIALGLFDGAVNQGRRTAAKRLQRAAGVADDGLIGPVTLGAINKTSQRIQLFDDFMARRGKRYGETANFDRYGRGWLRRLLHVHAIGRHNLM